MTTSKIGPHEQQLREMRKQQASSKNRHDHSKTFPESTKDWRKQLASIKSNSKRKGRSKS